MGEVISGFEARDSLPNSIPGNTSSPGREVGSRRSLPKSSFGAHTPLPEANAP